MNTNIESIVLFIAAQMDGAQVPPAGSADFDRLSEAIAAIQASPTDAVLRSLALGTLGAVIDRTCANIEAQKALWQFLQGGDHAA